MISSVVMPDTCSSAKLHQGARSRTTLVVSAFVSAMVAWTFRSERRPDEPPWCRWDASDCRSQLRLASRPRGVPRLARRGSGTSGVGSTHSVTAHAALDASAAWGYHAHDGDRIARP